MTRILFATLLLLWPCVGLAQDLRVRSGEHGDFTRLVFDMPADTEWRVTQPERRSLLVKFDTQGLKVDLSQVFDRISTERISEVTPLTTGIGVSIGLGCDCDADSFLYQEDMLVVDIRDSTGGETLFESGDAFSDPPDTPARATTDQHALSELRLGSDPGIGPQETGSVLFPQFLSEEIGRAGAQPEKSSAIHDGVFEKMLVEQLARAATEGLLVPAVSLPRAHENTAIPDAFSVSVPHDRPPTIDASISSGDPHDPETRIRIGGDVCIGDTALDISSWGTEDTLENGIPELRSRLFGEFDRFDEDTAAALAKAYVYLGFGAEARALLDLLSEPPDQGVFALAGIVDGQIDGAGVFADQSNCEGAAALWSLLGSASLPERAKINSNAVIRSFEALPLHLRTLLGPRLAIRLAEEGAPESARSVLSRLARARGETNEQMAFSSAQLDLLDGAEGSARPKLEHLADGTGSNAARAIADTIEIAIRDGESIDPKVGDLAGAYATELRDTDQGPKLWLAQIRALAAAGRYDEAFRVLLSDLDHPVDSRPEAASDALRLLEGNANDTDFLKHALTGADRFDGLARPAVALTVASRLLDLEFPDAAERWMSLGGVDRAARETRLLRARLHLARSEPEQAEIALVGLQGDDALRLRALAREMMGDFEYATTAYASIGDVRQSEHAAWLAGDWTRLDGRNDPIGMTAGIAETRLPAVEEAPPSLAMAEELAGTSSNARETLRRLLDETRVGDE